MKTIKIIIMMLAAISVSFAADSSEDRTIKRARPGQASESRLALIIGNAAYKSSPLKNPLNDAGDMAKTLRQLGFEVIIRTNAGLQDMDDAINDFGKKLRNAEIGLFYFSGHGVQVNGENYLIPTDAAINRENEIKFKAINAGLVLAAMADAGNRVNIVILDACRDNPFARSFRSSRQGLAVMDATKGMLIAYSTSPNSVASDGSGRNGTYTENLLKYLTVPGLKVEEVFKKVREGVLNDTSDKQLPWETTSLRGDFYFASSGAAVYDSPKPPPAKTTLSVKCNADGARVSVDGIEIGETPLKDLSVSAGEHRIIIEKDGHETYRESVRIDEGQAVSLRVELSRIKKTEPVAAQTPSEPEVMGNNVALVNGVFITREEFKWSNPLKMRLSILHPVR